SRKPETETLALVTCGFCPLILLKLSTADSSRALSCVARPTPILMTIFSSLGIAILLGRLNFWAKPCAIVVLYWSSKRAIFESSFSAVRRRGRGAGARRSSIRFIDSVPFRSFHFFVAWAGLSGPTLPRFAEHVLQ